VGQWNKTKAELFTRLNLDEAIRNEIENHSLTDAVITREAFDERADVLINSILRIKPDIIAFQENDMEPIFHYKKEFADLYTNSFVYEHAHLEKKLSNGKMNNIKRENELGSYFVGDGVSIYVRKERFEIVSVCKAFTSQQNPILHVVVKDVLDQNHLYNVITTHLSSGDNETDHRMRTIDLKELGEYIRIIDQKENIVLMMDANENVKKRNWLPDVVGE
jgi:mRNA deadenylase 3'-5' endonuclease subunit Ccr4